MTQNEGLQQDLAARPTLHDSLNDASLISLSSPVKDIERRPSLGKFQGGSYVCDEEQEPLELADRISVETSDAVSAKVSGGSGEPRTSGIDASVTQNLNAEASPDQEAEMSQTAEVSIGKKADALLQTSPFLQSLLERIVRLEADGQMRDSRIDSLASQVEQLKREVNHLQREHPSSARASPLPPVDTLRRLSEQVDTLSGNVSQLMLVQASHQSGSYSPVTSRSVTTDPGYRTRSTSPVDQFRRISAQLSPIPVDSPTSARTSPMLASTPAMEGSAKVTWEDTGLPTTVAQAAVQCGLGEGPSKVSATAIAHLMRDSDVVLHAPAVRDRLASIVLPSVAFLQSSTAKDSIQILVVASTIEQASQIHRWYTTLGVRAAVSAANIDLPAELANLQTRVPEVLVGLPQRLLDLLALRALPLPMLRLLVIDEADHIVARNLSDFVLSMVRILPPSEIATGRQTCILGSTISNDVLLFASSLGLREPVRVLVKRETAATRGDQAPSVRGIRHHYLWIAMASKSAQASAWKLEALSDLLEDVQVRQAIVWCATMDTVDAVTQTLSFRGLDVHSLHEGVAAQARQAILTHFTNSNNPKKILVLSEALVGAIGDLQRVPLVVNYDLPSCAEDYVYRVSYAAASGYARPGVACNLLTNQYEWNLLRHIESFWKLQIAELPPHLSALG